MKKLLTALVVLASGITTLSGCAGLFSLGATSVPPSSSETGKTASSIETASSDGGASSSSSSAWAPSGAVTDNARYRCEPYTGIKNAEGEVEPCLVNSAVTSAGKDQYQVYLGIVRRMPVEIYSAYFTEIPIDTYTFAYSESSFVSNEAMSSSYVSNTCQYYHDSASSGSSSYATDQNNTTTNGVEVSAGATIEEVVNVGGKYNWSSTDYNAVTAGRANSWSDHTTTSTASTHTYSSFSDIITQNYSASSYSMTLKDLKKGSYRYGMFTDCDAYIYATTSYKDGHVYVENLTAEYCPIGTPMKGIDYTEKDNFDKDPTTGFFDITENFLLNLDYAKDIKYQDFSLADNTDSSQFSFTSTGEDTTTLTGYRGTATEVKIPTAYGGRNVTAIGPNAFSGNTTLLYLSCPSAITSIGDSAFEGCSNLSKMELPSSLTSIGDGAFENCPHLRYFNLPKTVAEAGYHAFYGDPRLPYAIEGSNYYLGDSTNPHRLLVRSKTQAVESFDIHADTKVIVGGAFENCTQIVGPNWNVTLPTGIVYVGRDAFAGAVVKSLVVPEGVKTVSAKAFEKCSYLKTVTLPSSLTEIGEYAFSDDTNLTGVDLPARLTKIGQYAFKNCAAITAVTIPSPMKAIENGTFSGCKKLATLVIPPSVASIDQEAFSDCESLASVSLPNTVTSIGESAFYECIALADIAIPSSVTSIGKSAFYGCGLNSVIIPSPVTSINSETFAFCQSLTSVSLPNTLTSIGYRAFYCCSALTSLTIPASVTSFGLYAISDCSKLDSLIIDAGNKTYSSDGKVLYNKDKTELFGCAVSSFGGNYTIPSSVTDIDGWAFSGCNALTGVSIPDSVTNIGEKAFYGCGLTSVKMPSSMTSLSPRAFGYCKSLAHVSFSNALTSIGESAFEGCSALTNLLLPWYVTDIGAHAFSGCGITSVQIPSSMTSLGFGVFSGCRSLASVSLPNTLTSIGESTFASDKKLVSIDVPSSVTTLGKDVFAYSGLTSITIPESLKIIPEGAFRDCESLTDITLPETFTDCEKYAFVGCSNFKTIHFQGSKGQFRSVWFHSGWCGDNEIRTLTVVCTDGPTTIRTGGL